METTEPRGRAVDLVVSLAILAGTVAYLAAIPFSLNPADESVHLYEAKRVLGGAVLYRDVFNFITPGWFYLMGGLFWLFGTSMATARFAMGVMHGLTAVLSYLTCRRFAVRPTLAWLPALAYVVIAQPAWPITSQHWVTTLLTAALLYVCAGRRRDSARWALWAGVVLGLLIGVQQQRGLFMGLGVFLWITGDAALQRWYRLGAPSVRWFAALAALAAGTLLTLVPLMAPSIIGAGVARVWYALVTFPVFNYRATTHHPWGSVNIMTVREAKFTVPSLLAYMPVVLLVTVSRLVVLWTRRLDFRRADILLLLVLFCTMSALSVAYSPDFIHLAFIAPVFFVTATESLEWAVQLIPVRPRVRQALGAVATAAILAVSGWRLADNLSRWQAAAPFSHTTRFGRLNFATEEEIELYETVDALLAGAPSRALYIYPVLSDLYLTAQAENPTPYGFFTALGYNTPAQVQQVLDILAEKQLPYVVVFAPFLTADDPIIHYLNREYEPVTTHPLANRAILRRRSSAATASAGRP